MTTNFSKAYHKVVDLLPTLSKQERASVSSILKRLNPELKQEEDREVRRELDRWTPTLFTMLVDTVGSGTREINHLPVGIARQIDDLCRHLNRYLVDVSADEGYRIGRKERMAWYKLYTTLTSRYLKERGVPVSIRTLVLNADKFPGLIERDFPGYQSNRLVFPVILLGELSRHTVDA